MRSFTSIEIIKGHLAADPELRYTANKGTPVAEFIVLSNRRTLNETTGEWEDTSTTRDVCKAFGRLAENIVASLATGTAVLVVGETQTETWTDKTTGETRYKDVVIVRAAAADLDRATATVTRNPKTDDDH